MNVGRPVSCLVCLATRIHIVNATLDPKKKVTCETGRLQFSSKRMKTPMYRQIPFAERYTLGLLRQRGLAPAAIARLLGRHRSTIGREVRRNRAHSDATYCPPLADWYARGRR